MVRHHGGIRLFPLLLLIGALALAAPPHTAAELFKPQFPAFAEGEEVAGRIPLEAARPLVAWASR